VRRSARRNPVGREAIVREIAAGRRCETRARLRLADQPTDNRLTADWIAPCLNDARICRDLAALLRQIATTDLTDVAARLTRFDKPVTLVWARAIGCSPQASPAAGRGVQQRETDRGARR